MTHLNRWYLANKHRFQIQYIYIFSNHEKYARKRKHKIILSMSKAIEKIHFITALPPAPFVRFSGGFRAFSIGSTMFSGLLLNGGGFFHNQQPFSSWNLDKCTYWEILQNLLNNKVRGKKHSPIKQIIFLKSKRNNNLGLSCLTKYKYNV